MEGGPLLDHIQRRGHFSEEEASGVAADLARCFVIGQLCRQRERGGGHA